MSELFTMFFFASKFSLCVLFMKRESFLCEFYITIGTVCILNLIISNILINIEGFFFPYFHRISDTKSIKLDTNFNQSGFIVIENTHFSIIVTITNSVTETFGIIKLNFAIHWIKDLYFFFTSCRKNLIFYF